MLTSFFGNSRPVNFLILGAFIFVAYIIGGIATTENLMAPAQLFSHFGLILISIFSMLLVDFVVKKNNLTQPNSFAAFFYTFFIGMLPLIFQEPNMLLANLFLLLALRRIMSLRNDTNSKKKILDASVWIAVASLFYFWSLLLLLPLWVAIIKKPNPDYKQMLVPFTGLAAVLLVNTAFRLLTTDSLQWFFEWKQPISLDFSSYNAPGVFIPITVILGFLLWTGVYRGYIISIMPLKSRPNYRLLLYVCVTYIFIALFTPMKTGAEVLFIIAPVAIITANYLENAEDEIYKKRDKTKIWFKEALMWLVVVLSIIFLIV